MANVGAQISTRLFIYNLPWTVNPQKLRSVFSQFGNLASSTVVFDKNTGFSRGFGFVTYKDEVGYRAALNAKSLVIDGLTVRVTSRSN